MTNDPTSDGPTGPTGPSAPDGPTGPATAVPGEAPAGAPEGGRAFFGHPRGLATLFFTEMWERFSYYGLRGLLILFMTASIAEGGLGFDTARAGAIYGLYTAFVYLMALPGGWIADRVIGQRRAVLWGGVIIAAGHFSMAIEGLTTFFLGLGLIIMGTGLLKPNISTMVGELYPEGGARRDAGFSIFYMGINIGAFTAPLLVGFLGEKVDWHAGFAVAGIGMILGLVQYVLGGRYLGDAGLEPDDSTPAVLARNRQRLVAGVLAVGAAIGVVALLDAVGVVDVTLQTVAGAGTAIIVTMAVLYFGYMFAAGGLGPVERKRVVVIGVLFLFSAVFWSGFEQAGSSLNLVAEDLTDRVIFGWEMPASWLQSVNPLFIIALAPVFAWLWVALGKREPSSPAKFAVGLTLLGAGFAVMTVATSIAASGAMISPAWLMVTYFLHTSGELALSPVGLSTVTKLAPHRMVGQMMGIWFMSISLGNLIAGQVAGRLGVGEAVAAGQVSASTAFDVFMIVTVVTVGSGLLLALFVKPVRKLMSGVH